MKYECTTSYIINYVYIYIYIYIYTKNWLDKDDQCCFPIYQGMTIVET